MYPSIPALLVKALSDQFPTVRVCTELPSNLETVLPVIQVNRFGGSGHTITLDRAYMDIDVWHTNLLAAETLASQVASWMVTYLPGKHPTTPAGTGVFASCTMQTGMMQRPSSNPDVRRVGGAFTVIVHSA